MARRRANGMGTVYKVKGRNLKNPYKALVTIGFSLEGVPIRKSLGYFRKESEADMALYEYAKQKEGFFLKKLTVKDVYDRWIVEHRERVKKTTMEHYESAYTAYISKIKDKVFSELKTLELQEFFNEIRTRQIQESVRAVLSLMYQYGMRYEIVDKNYATLLILKKKIKVKEIIPFKKAEIDNLFTLDNRIAKALCVMIYTGMRIDEFLSLTKNDILNNFIYVREAKTEAGIRPVPIHNRIKPIINFFLAEEKEYLYTWKENKKASYETFRNNMIKLMKELGTPHTPHDTRHTFASMMNKVGANDVALTTMIGHTDVNLTKSIYTHKELEDLEETMKLLS